MKATVKVYFRDGEAKAVCEATELKKEWICNTTGNKYNNVYIANYSRGEGWIIFSEDGIILESNIEGHTGIEVLEFQEGRGTNLKNDKRDQKMEFVYNKNDFFDKDGWIKFDNFKVAVGQKGELEYCDPLKNAQYYEQNPYYKVVEISPDENDIQNDADSFEKMIKEKLTE